MALPISETKLRGGYYTPPPIAKFLASWAVRTGSERILEPSGGDGAFVAVLRDRLTRTGALDVLELHPEEGAKISKLEIPRVTVEIGDAFSWYLRTCPEAQYTAVLGNPPFIRYQNFPEAHRDAGFSLMAEEGLRPNRLTNAWVPFIVLATRALATGGRLAMVVPAELLQVSYAAELREYLVRKYSQLGIVTFRKLVFAGIQQETVLLLGVRRDSSVAQVSFVQLDAIEDLAEFDLDSHPRAPADLNHAREKWTQYFLSKKELGLVRELETSNTLTTLGELAEVDVGIVTGRNEFFVLTPSEARSRELLRHCLPLVGRSAQIPGLVLGQDEWEGLADADGRCLLLQLGDTERDALSRQARQYVEEGEAAGFHTGYKCKIRLPNWWKVPSDHAPDAFLLRQIHDGPRIVLNTAGAVCTDTIHRVRALPGTDPAWLAAASMNSLTFAFSEIRGRSYGGGVLELEPTEAESLPFPKPAGALPLEDLDLWARRKEPEQVLDEVDRLVLLPAGISRTEGKTLRGIWRNLSDRRANRKRR